MLKNNVKIIACKYNLLVNYSKLPIFDSILLNFFHNVYQNFTTHPILNLKTFLKTLAFTQVYTVV